MQRCFIFFSCVQLLTPSSNRKSQQPKQPGLFPGKERALDTQGNSILQRKICLFKSKHVGQGCVGRQAVLVVNKFKEGSIYIPNIFFLEQPKSKWHPGQWQILLTSSIIPTTHTLISYALQIPLMPTLPPFYLIFFPYHPPPSNLENQKAEA